MTDEPGLCWACRQPIVCRCWWQIKRRGAVAAFHAGWRGTVQRIVEGGVAQMRAEFGSVPGDLVAAVGPSIRSCCYAVGGEAQAEFRSSFGYADDLFSERGEVPGKEAEIPLLHRQRSAEYIPLRSGLYLNLAQANWRQLLDAGLRMDAIEALRSLHQLPWRPLLFPPRRRRICRPHADRRSLRAQVNGATGGPVSGCGTACPAINNFPNKVHTTVIRMR